MWPIKVHILLWPIKVHILLCLSNKWTAINTNSNQLILKIDSNQKAIVSKKNLIISATIGAKDTESQTVVATANKPMG